MKYPLSLSPMAALMLLLMMIFSTIAATAQEPLGREREKKRRERGEREEDPAKRAEWEFLRLRDPATGTVPPLIRAKELIFSQTIPSRSGGAAFARGSGAAGLQWTARGPANVGGRTRALALDATNPNIMLAGGASGGMWRSTDAGASWKKTTAPTALQAVSCIAQDTRPGKEHIWYYGTGEHYGGFMDLYWGDGLFKSVDGGVTWAPIASTSAGTPAPDRTFDMVSAVVVDPSNLAEDEIYAATFGCIQRSTDGGATWRIVLGTFARGGGFTEVAVTRTGVVYATLSSYNNQRPDGAATITGVYRSVDGITWTNITPEFMEESARITLGIAPSNENVVYFLADTRFGMEQYLARYTYLSGDGSGSGGRWEDRSHNIPTSADNEYGGFSGQGGYCLVVRVKPDDENTLFIGGVNLFRSANGFADRSETAWIGGMDPLFGNVFTSADALAYPNHWVDQHAILFHPSNPAVMFTGNDGGVQRTDNCMAERPAWTKLNNGYLTSQFYTIAVDHGTSGDPTLIGGMQDNGIRLTRSADPDVPWSIEHPTGDGAYAAIADGGTSFYTSSQYGSMVRLVPDANGKFTQYAYVTPLNVIPYNFINPFALDPSDQKIVYFVGAFTLWRNDDITVIPTESADAIDVATLQGTAINWTELAGSNVTEGRIISALAVSTANPAHRLYYGTNDGRIYRLDDAHTGSPAATDITAPAMPRRANVSCIAVDPKDGNRALAVFSNYNVVSLFLTTNAGETWTPVAGNLEAALSGAGNGPACFWASILHAGSTTYHFVGTSTGLYSTTLLDGTSTQWTREGDDLIGSSVVTMIDVRQSDGLVAVATFGGGAFTANVAPSGVQTDPAADASLVLHEITPNPVQGDAAVRFTVRQAGRGTVRLYDEIGREVMTLLERNLPAGEGSVTLRAEGLPAGVYYCRLEVAGESRTRQFVVMR